MLYWRFMRRARVRMVSIEQIGSRFDRKRHGSVLLRDLGKAVEIPLVDLPFAHRIARNPALFGEDALAQLLA